jgi:hypothetical protein
MENPRIARSDVRNRVFDWFLSGEQQGTGHCFPLNRESRGLSTITLVFDTAARLSNRRTIKKPSEAGSVAGDAGQG